MVVGKPYDHTKSCVLSTLDESLTALGMKKIDLYYLHAPDRETPFEETLEAVNEAYQAGKFERFGISNFKVDEVEAVVKIIEEKKYPFKVSVYQGLYNAVTRSAEAELIPTLRKHGISYYTYNPLGELRRASITRALRADHPSPLSPAGGGFFTGRIKSPSDVVESGSRFDANRTQGQSYRKRYYRDEYFEAIKIVSAAAEKAKLSMAEVALRWMQHHSELDTKKHGDGVIIGASSLGHIEQNLVDFEKGPLPQEVVRSVDEAVSRRCEGREDRASMVLTRSLLLLAIAVEGCAAQRSCLPLLIGSL